ncbi:MAG: DUF134 domain-containing protein [Candidatus Diapherotrites archaeon]
MPRPRMMCRVSFRPSVVFFKPAGVPLARMKVVSLSPEGLEAIRLSYVLDFDQSTAAQKMGISQPTFHRILLEANRQVAKALVEGHAIRLEMGNSKMKDSEAK